jgi:GNAT superfamily N-acetyltransferase
MTSIRRATTHDAIAISHVQVQTWRTTYSGIVPDEYLTALNEVERVAVWREQLAHGMLIYVADQAGEVVGFIGGGPVRESVQTYDAELYAIYLLQRSQGQGIGTALLKQLARSLLNEGFTSMLVWVLEKNPSKHFYTKANAQFVTSKDIRIGGALLAEEAYGWPDLSAILHA